MKKLLNKSQLKDFKKELNIKPLKDKFKDKPSNPFNMFNNPSSPDQLFNLLPTNPFKPSPINNPFKPSPTNNPFKPSPTNNLWPTPLLEPSVDSEDTDMVVDSEDMVD